MNSYRHLTRIGRIISKTANQTAVSRQCFAPLPLLLKRSTGHRSISSSVNSRETVFQKVNLESKVHDVTVSDTIQDQDNKMLEVKWGDGTSDIYPYIWLRDNCQCPQCYHTSSKNRITLIGDLQMSVFPSSTQLSQNGAVLEIEWSDGHKAYYPSEWLQPRAFTETKRAKRMEFIELKRSLWNADITRNLPRGSFFAALNDDNARLKVLQQLEEFGLVILQGAPLKRGQIEALSNRVGFTGWTPYGNVFSVQSKANAQNLAYTANTLDLHVDLAHLDFKPGIQILHCITQTKDEGGETLFVDGFNVADKLRELHPEKFDVLTKIPVAYKDEGVKERGLELCTINEVPMICLDHSGTITSVVSSQLMRDSFFNINIKDVKHWYDAMIVFTELLNLPENVFSYKMCEGDVIIFDNTRILHGRHAYQVSAGHRELEGCYWDWDMARSCRRVLQNRILGR